MFTEIGLAAHIREIFQFTLSDASMVAVINQRGSLSSTFHDREGQFDLAHRTRPVPVVPKSHANGKRKPVSESAPKSHIVLEDCQGAMLSLRERDCKVALQVYVDDDGVKLYCDGAFMGYTPPDTRAGDWILRFTTNSHRTMDLAITARRLPGGDYALKGYIHTSRNWELEVESTSMELHRSHLKRFSISWDAQDFLLFECHILHRPTANQAVRSDIKRWVKLKICDVEGTSIATGSKDIEKP